MGTGLRRRDIWIGIMILFLALCLRLIYLYETRDSPFSSTLVMDQAIYDGWAKDILTRSILGFKSEHFWQPPLYPYFLALVYKIFGVSYPVIRLVQALLGALTCCLLYLFTVRLFGRSAAVIAGLAGALYGPLIYAGGEFSPVNLVVFLNLTGLYLLLSNPGNRSWGLTLAAGTVIGLAAVAKPVVLPGAAWLALWLFAREKDKRPRARLRHPALFIAAMILMILPVTLRNYRVTGELFLISTNGGINFLIGNNAHYDEIVASRPGFYRENYLAAVESVMQSSAGPSEVSSKFFAQGLNYIAAQPVDYLKLLCRKSYLFWHGKEILRDSSAYFFTQYSHLLRPLLWQKIIYFPFGIVAPLALIGLFLGWRRSRDLPWIIGYFIIYWGAIMLFFVTSRYRLPLVPILLAAAAFASVELFAKAGRKERGAVWLLALFILLAIPLNHPAGVAHRYADTIYETTPYYQLGEIYYRNGQWDESLKAYGRVLEMMPGEPRFEKIFRTNVRQIIGDIHLEKADPREAVHFFKEDIRYNPRAGDTYIKLIRTLEESGDTGEALQALEKGRRLFEPSYYLAEKARLSGMPGGEGSDTAAPGGPF